MFFLPETIVASFLHPMVLFFKVILNHDYYYSMHQFVKCTHEDKILFVNNARFCSGADRQGLNAKNLETCGSRKCFQSIVNPSTVNRF